MLILSRVCADFYDRNNHLLHRFIAPDLGRFLDVPESIKEDPLFQRLWNRILMPERRRKGRT